MKVLILGGTAFLSRETALAFIRAGDDVVCAARGVSGSAPEGARFVTWDRNNPPPRQLSDLQPDVVVDVSTDPGHVGDAVDLFPDARWIYISTISVYSDLSAPQGRPDTTPTLDPIRVDDGEPESYGGLKVACESSVRLGTRSSFIVRPGLIVGPGDTSGRFSYWPLRLAAASRDGKPFIAPGPLGDPVQWVDVRDLAAWIVVLANSGHDGVCDAIGPSVPRHQFLADIASLFSPVPEPVWVTPEDLTDQHVRFWSGERSLPFWIPVEDMRGMLDRDAAPASELGFRLRPLVDTARDTLTWASTQEPKNFLTRDDELSVLQKLGYFK